MVQQRQTRKVASLSVVKLFTHRKANMLASLYLAMQHAVYTWIIFVAAETGNIYVVE